MARITLKDSGVIFNKENHTYELNGKMLQGITTMLQRQLFSTEYEGIPWAIVKKAGEYGAHMFYCFTTGRYLSPDKQYNNARKCISNIAKLWYNDEVICEPLDDIHKDW